MTGYDAPPTTGGAGRPPLSLELLADLHAGVLDDRFAEEVRAQVAADPQAQATLAALDATTAQLGDLPPITIPDDVAARIDAALRDEAAGRVATHSPQGVPFPVTVAPPAAPTGHPTVPPLPMAPV
ncbi:MAG TPA: hypothetical protein VGD67_10870, partial [Pseudonocardiaceae bacterium]